GDWRRVERRLNRNVVDGIVARSADVEVQSIIDVVLMIAPDEGDRIAFRIQSRPVGQVFGAAVDDLQATGQASADFDGPVVLEAPQIDIRVVSQLGGHEQRELLAARRAPEIFPGEPPVLDAFANSPSVVKRAARTLGRTEDDRIRAQAGRGYADIPEARASR